MTVTQMQAGTGQPNFNDDKCMHAPRIIITSTGPEPEQATAPGAILLACQCVTCVKSAKPAAAAVCGYR